MELTDHVHVSGVSSVTRSISKPGVYTRNRAGDGAWVWLKNFARLRQLDDMVRRVKALEQELARCGRMTMDANDPGSRVCRTERSEDQTLRRLRWNAMDIQQIQNLRLRSHAGGSGLSKVEARQASGGDQNALTINEPFGQGHFRASR